jgi:hypothetical protein
MTEILRIMPDKFAGFSKEDAERQQAEEKKAEAERKRLEDLARGNASGGNVVVPVPDVLPVQNPLPAGTPDRFRISSAAGQGYLLDGVEFDDKLLSLRVDNSPIPVDLLERILGGRTFKTWKQYAETTIEVPHPVSARLYHTIFKALYLHKDQPEKASLIESARSDLGSIINKHRIITITKIKRDRSNGCTFVDHNDLGRSSDDFYFPATLGECILGERDPEQVANIYKWLTGNLTFWTPCEKLKYGGERVFSIVTAQTSDDNPKYTCFDANTKPSKHGYAIGVSILKAEIK